MPVRPAADIVAFLKDPEHPERWEGFLRWWDQDWSWEGLAKKEWRKRTGANPKGTVSGTLQNYWTKEAKRLIDFAGRRWTFAHLPPCDRFGNLCAPWERVKDWLFLTVIDGRLPERAVSEDTVPSTFGNDLEMAAFCGVVFPNWTPSPDKTVAADFSCSVFLGWANFSRRIICSRFDQTLFLGGDADFRLSKFIGGDAEFMDTSFAGGEARFDGAMFSDGNAWFTRALFSGGIASFFKAQFAGGTADFGAAAFSGGNAVFSEAQFSGGTSQFEGALFSRGATLF